MSRRARGVSCKRCRSAETSSVFSRLGNRQAFSCGASAEDQEPWKREHKVTSPAMKKKIQKKKKNYSERMLDAALLPPFSFLLIRKQIQIKKPFIMLFKSFRFVCFWSSNNEFFSTNSRNLNEIFIRWESSWILWPVSTGKNREVSFIYLSEINKYTLRLILWVLQSRN